MAGQCGKLKCCLNYELDSYVDALKVFPDNNIKLKTAKGRAFFRKMDIFKGVMWYSYESDPIKFIELKVERVNEILALNKEGKDPQDLMDFVEKVVEIKSPNYENVVGQDSLTRFDKPKGSGNKNKRKKNNNRKPNNNPNGNNNNKPNHNENKPKTPQNTGGNNKGKRPNKNRKPNNNNNNNRNNPKPEKS